MDATLASYLLAIINAASTFGRVIPGVLADKFGRLNIVALTDEYSVQSRRCLCVKTGQLRVELIALKVV
jgi:hypothetical protein